MTDMNCVATVVGETRSNAYAHHIQRLMVTGNFALLAGIDPKQVHQWYLEVYADAYEWVEMPNVIGMSQFADGGIVGTKPYAASGNYISRMSDYCDGCGFNVKERTGPAACPFNHLYWDFLSRNRRLLAGNRRLARQYATWDRMDGAVRRDIVETAARFLAALQGY
jgi:deoxyribodipyrimidine photolyase-related protein